MRTHRVEVSVPRTSSGSIHYLAVEHNGVAPIEFLRAIIHQHNFGILILGTDGPSLLVKDHAERSVHAMTQEEIAAIAMGEFVWVNSEAASRICEKDWFTCEGIALLLRKKHLHSGLACSELPELSGFNKDTLSPKATSTLEGMLSAHSIYVHDAFSETLIATTDAQTLDSIADQVRLLAKTAK